MEVRVPINPAESQGMDKRGGKTTQSGLSDVDEFAGLSAGPAWPEPCGKGSPGMLHSCGLPTDGGNQPTAKKVPGENLALSHVTASRRSVCFGLATWALALRTFGDTRGVAACNVGPPEMTIDPATLQAHGIQSVSSSRLVLYTDLPLSSAIAELPQVFEAAFPQWCRYFGVDPARHPRWQCKAILIGRGEHIIEAGLLPPELPPFRFGFARGREIWFVNPPSDYYRRHLLLHEGVHAFMNTILGDCGPTWYMEGIAEYLATHRWEDGRLELAYFPRQADELSLWGRIRMVRQDLQGGKFLRLEDILGLRPRDDESVELYGWCWAAATFFDRHPRYQQAFRSLPQWVRRAEFNQHFRQMVGPYWPWAEHEWALFVHTLEFGHDLSREAIDFTPGIPLPPQGREVTVAADRGWQNTGIFLDKAVQYEILARGRYQLGQHPVIWWCEPNGVTIRYYRGKPLGMLLGAVVPADQSFRTEAGSFVNPHPLGLRGLLIPSETGTLFLRVNDSPAELADNVGSLTAVIRPMQPAA